MKRFFLLYSLCVVVFVFGAIIQRNFAFAGETVSNKIAVPLKKAEQFLKQGKTTQADVAIREAQAIAKPSIYEQQIIEKLKIASALKQNKIQDALSSYDRLIKIGHISLQEQQNIVMAQASLAYRNKNYSKAIEFINHYFRIGGNNSHMKTLLIQSYFLNKDYKNALAQQKEQINFEVKQNIIPAESQWLILANCQEKLGDFNSLRQTYLQLATHYPKAIYWSKIMSSITGAKNTSPSVQLAVAEFQYRNGLLMDAKAYTNAAEIALQVGVPHLAEKIILAGQSQNIFVGQDAERAARLEIYIKNTITNNEKNQINALNDAKTNLKGDRLFLIGYDQFIAGQKDGGLALMKQALEKEQVNTSVNKLYYAL
ncbi:hypothetical protein, partial [Commensalibacter sp. Nvir]|uniref:tetratricopeptide repeat protein n=1 Tax=Commensalibacter sp. Nvir TaxID=3069817 RepID=UPI0030C8C083